MPRSPILIHFVFSLTRIPWWPAIITVRIPTLVVALALVLVTACKGGQAPLVPLPSQEQEVIEAFLRDEIEANTARYQMVRDVASVGHLNFTNGWAEFVAALREESKQHNASFTEAIEDMVKNNEAGAQIGIPSAAGDDFRLVSEARLQEMKAGSLTNNSQSDDSPFGYDALLVTVSRPGFDSTRNLAIVCFSTQNRWHSSVGRISVLKREGNRWVLELYRRILGNALGPGAIKTVCELRYYKSGFSTEHLQVVRNDGTNLVCSAADPAKLWQTTNGLSPWDVTGFILQVVEPSAFAGQPVTAHFDGPLPSGDPFMAFAFGKRYELELQKETIGDLDFRLCY